MTQSMSGLFANERKHITKFGFLAEDGTSLCLLQRSWVVVGGKTALTDLVKREMPSGVVA